LVSSPTISLLGRKTVFSGRLLPEDLHCLGRVGVPPVMKSLARIKCVHHEGDISFSWARARHHPPQSASSCHGCNQSIARICRAEGTVSGDRLGIA
jgi:hypothetical protein